MHVKSRRNTPPGNAEPTGWPRPVLLIRCRWLGRYSPNRLQTLEVYDPLVAKIEAVLEHRRALVNTRILMLHRAGDQLATTERSNPDCANSRSST